MVNRAGDAARGLDAAADWEATLAAYQQDPERVVRSGGPSRLAAAEPNDPDFDTLYGLDNKGQTGGLDDADIDAPKPGT